MKRLVWLMGALVAVLMASGPSCGATVVTGSGAGGSGAIPQGGADGGWVDGTWADGADGSWVEGPNCWDCACYSSVSDAVPGCAEVCDMTISGSSTPNFCNGSTALAQCAQCIMSYCGVQPVDCY